MEYAEIEEQAKLAEEQFIRRDERRKTLKELQFREFQDFIKKPKKIKKNNPFGVKI